MAEGGWVSGDQPLLAQRFRMADTQDIDTTGKHVNRLPDKPPPMTTTDNQQDAGTATTTDVSGDADVIVVGAGMAGLTAGVRAVELGARPVVVEKGTRVGGSMRLSAGVVWTYGSVAAAREAVPRGDPTLQRIVVESLADRLDWLSDHGIEVRDPPDDGTPDAVGAPAPEAKCGHIEPEAFCDRAVEVIEAGEGELHTETPMTSLLTDELGRVVGATVSGPDGPRQVTADAVVLATGGFQGSEELLQAYVTRRIENVWLRSNPWSTGDGFRAAREAGAVATAGLDTFYGHNMVAPPGDVSPDGFVGATQYYGPFAVAIDRHGNRFTDESESDFEHTLAQDTLHEANGRAYYVLDSDLYEDTVSSVGHVGTIIERAKELGGQVLSAGTVDGLGEELTGAGVAGERAVRTIRTYNEAVRAGEAHLLDPPRRGNHRTITSPPFYAVRVQPGITHTMGGLGVDHRMRVRRQSGSRSGLFDYETVGEPEPDRAIPGLYAAGVDIGGINNRGYMGGLSTAVVTGYRAVEAAVGEVDR